MKWIVTGAGGFVGKALCKRLLEIGEEVRIMPREMLTSFFSMEEYLYNERPDYIVHLAAYGNYHDQTDIDGIYAVNVDYLLNLLQASKNIDYKGFINFSSSSVLGGKSTGMRSDDFPETDTFYGASKLAGEYLCYSFGRQFHKPIVSVRPFSITGIGEQSNHLIPTLIRSCLYGEEMPFVGSPSHDFIDIDDVVRAILCISKEISVPIMHRPVHLGNAKGYSNNAVKNIVERVTGKMANLKSVKKLRSYDSPRWRNSSYDKSIIKALYKWEPQKSLKKSIREMVNHELTT